MREQILVGMLTLAFAVGFIFSIEGLAQNSRNLLEPCTHSSSAGVGREINAKENPETCSDLNQNYAWGY